MKQQKTRDENRELIAKAEKSIERVGQDISIANKLFNLIRQQERQQCYKEFNKVIDECVGYSDYDKGFVVINKKELLRKLKELKSKNEKEKQE